MVSLAASTLTNCLGITFFTLIATDFFFSPFFHPALPYAADNSSRFGKWMKVGLNNHFLIQGCEIINYLLEKSRVVTQSSMERNYHIFYQLIAGADGGTKKRLHLKAPAEYNYLNQSGTFICRCPFLELYAAWN
jgi:hypothetical protein